MQRPHEVEPPLAPPASRRGVLLGLTALIAAGFDRPARAIAHACRMVVDADEGPFYPVDPIPKTNDLLLAADGQPPADGELVYLAGLVTGTGCKPLAHAAVEIWQCDAGGQYRHPRAPVTKALDPGFHYFGRTTTGPDGFYRFRTVRPAPYKVFGIERAPHFHIRVKHSEHPTLTTEAYFAGARDDALRQKDRVFLSRGARRGEMVVALEPARPRAEWLRIAPEADALTLRFDLGLGAGAG
jgi:protocatechuate 3,4-dioxygenase, beta subunit